MAALTVSVIVVSRGRPDALCRCLTGIEQLDFTGFEVVVVADAAGLAGLDRAGFGRRVKSVQYDEPNISAARNLGLQKASGDVIAFIDDDAVPEPTWLGYLVSAFAQADVAAAGGYVIGRNGISFQHRARRVDARGTHAQMRVPDDTITVLPGIPGDAVKTEGTNCAFRADVLRRLGGFDPAYRFYLDETDVNLRIAAAGLPTALVPLAQVHHGFAASDRRLTSRMPTSLYEIAASQAVFLRKHAPSEVESGLVAMRDEQRRRLLRFMVAGLCVPGDVGRLLATFDAGADDGRTRQIRDNPPLVDPKVPFHGFVPRRKLDGMKILAGRSWNAGRLRRQAQALLNQGHRVSLYIFSPTALFHAVSFQPDGFWQQSGGLFGRSGRSGPLFRWTSFADRVQEERQRVCRVKEITPPELGCPKAGNSPEPT